MHTTKSAPDDFSRIGVRDSKKSFFMTLERLGTPVFLKSGDSHSKPLDYKVPDLFELVVRRIETGELFFFGMMLTV